MRYDPEKHHRRSIRLKGYDYRTPGAYFVTIVTQDRECLFGQIVDGTMHLNDAGRMVEWWWHELNHKFPTVRTDAYIIMPNHFHGIIQILPSPTPAPPSTTPAPQGAHTGAPLHPPHDDACTGAPMCAPPSATPAPPSTTPAPPSTTPAPQGAHTGAPLPDMVQWFKTMTTNAYIQGVKQHEWQPFNRRLWHRNDYEHIIRSEQNHNEIRCYIETNPLRWHTDPENPLQETQP